MGCRLELDVHIVLWPNRTCDCGKLAATLTVLRCRDGRHRSETSGYGHQRCVVCGLEWDFYPPAHGVIHALALRASRIYHGFEIESMNGVVCTIPDTGLDTPPHRLWCVPCQARYRALKQLALDLSALSQETAEPEAAGAVARTEGIVTGGSTREKTSSSSESGLPPSAEARRWQDAGAVLRERIGQYVDGLCISSDGRIRTITIQLISYLNAYDKETAAALPAVQPSAEALQQLMLKHFNPKEASPLQHFGTCGFWKDKPCNCPIRQIAVALPAVGGPPRQEQHDEEKDALSRRENRDSSVSSSPPHRSDGGSE